MALQAPLSWIRDFVNPKINPDNLAEKLTTAGLEVELIEKLGEKWGEYCVVGQICAVRNHPNADVLNLVDVEFGADKPITLVTGAPNVEKYKSFLPNPAPKVALALSGAILVDAYDEKRKLKKLKPSKIRGINSDGMLCSELELGLSENHDGIIILPNEAPIGQLLKEYLGDTILHFDIKGGFSHLLSILGVAREISALTGIQLKKGLIPNTNELEIVEQPPFVNLEIRDPDKCSRYSALLIRNVKIGESPFWIKQRLLRVGMRPINNIVDITNYVMMELGQPLHAFDYDKLLDRAKGGIPKIIVRRAKKNESLLTLDGEERKLDSNMLMISDKLGIIAIAGIMGGIDSEVSEDTKNILLESANFEFLNNRRSSQLLKLKTEASERFGKKVDPSATLKAAYRAAKLMTEYASGEIEKIAGDLYLKQEKLISIKLDPKYVENLLGIKISTVKIKEILESLEFKVSGENILEVTVPSHRMDIRIPADLVEEIVRVYGYENLTPTLIKEELPPQNSNQRIEITENIRDILVSLGLDEIITYSMMNPMDETILKLKKNVDFENFVPLKNPLSKERSHLRLSLLPGALLTAKTNLKYIDKLSTFEVGSVFYPHSKNKLPDEPQHISFLMSGLRDKRTWLDKNDVNYNFFDLKGLLESFFDSLNISGIEWIKSRDLPCHPGRSVKIIVNKKILGFAGELHPKIRKYFELPEKPVCIAELNLDILLELAVQDHQMEFISNYAPILEDLSIVVDSSLPVNTFASFILETGKPLLRDVSLFDVYEGDQMESGKRSLSYSLVFQAKDKTLTDKEVEKIRKKIIKKLEEKFKVTLRV